MRNHIGGSLLRDLEVDLLVTGELSHHETLAAIEDGKCVIARESLFLVNCSALLRWGADTFWSGPAFHSNTERQYLHDVMQRQLADALNLEWWNVQEDFREKQGVEPSEKVLHPRDEIYKVDFGEVAVSNADRDPYDIYTVEATR